MKILYVSTISNTINAFLIPHIKLIVNKGHTVDIACNIQKAIDKSLVELGCRVHNINFSRYPQNKNNIKAYRDLKKLIIDQKYDLVHTHTPVASAITRLVCKNIKKTKVFYTVHGFHFYKGAPLINWLIYYPLEKWLAKYTDTIITINKEDYERVRSKFKVNRVEYMPGVGLDIDKFRNVVVDKATKREGIGVPQNSFVVLSVGELNKNKNHELIIKAIARLNNLNIHYVICGTGPLESYLKKLLNELGISDNVHLLGFRKDIPEICKISDVFAFPSRREGLPVSLMEAMAAGLPIVCSNIRGNSDLIKHKIGGFLVKKRTPKEYAKNIENILKSNKNSRMKEVNLKEARKFDIGPVLLCLEQIYGWETRANDLKKILHILNTNRISGAENVAADICMMLKNEYHLVYSSPNGSIQEALKVRGVEFYPLKKVKFSEVRKAIKDIKPHIIHAHDVKSTVISVLSTGEIPIISHLHGNNENMRKMTIKSLVYLIASRRVKHILYVSESCLDDYFFKSQILNKSTYLKNVVYLPRIKKLLNLDKNCYNFDFCFVGRLSYAKNPERVAKIAADVLKQLPNCKFGVIGEGDYKDKMIRIFENNNVLEQVTFTGNLKYPYRAISETKVIFMCSKFEGTPIVVLESLALGIPVVATKTDGLSELIEDKKTGFLCNSDEELSENIIYLINNENIRFKVGEFIVKKASIDQIEEFKDILINIYSKYMKRTIT